MNRRELMQAGGLLGGALALPAAADRASGGADLIVTGGNLYSVDPAVEGTAMAIRGDRILAVGSDAQIGRYLTARTKVIDARGLTVVPGFIDAHSHPSGANEAISADVNVRTIAEVQEKLVAQSDGLSEGMWVLGHMYDDTKFVEGRPLLRSDIDAVLPNVPVMVRHRGGHTAVVNSKAFELLGVTAATPDPEGGRYFRENGELTGKVAEHAMDAFDHVGIWPKVDAETAWRGASLLSSKMAAAGLTSTTDAAGSAQSWHAYLDALEHDALHLRMSFMPIGPSDIYPQLARMGLRSGWGNHRLRLGAVKFFADGSASERTMRMSTPFQGTDDYGILTMSQGEIDSAVDNAVRRGFRVAIHANGDVTIDMVLKAYERALSGWRGDNPRFRIEHCSLINDDLLRRIKSTGTIPAPFYTYAHYHGNKWVDYGPEKMEFMFAHRSFLDHDIPVAPASDFTPGPYEPLMAIQSMVTRKDTQGRVWGPSQRIRAFEALKICTMHGAYASFEENEKGSLTPGKLADFVLLEDDPMTTDPDYIKDIRVVATYMGGRATYEA